MTKKLTRLEAFQELSVQLARIENKLDILLEQKKVPAIEQLIIDSPPSVFTDEFWEETKKLFDECPSNPPKKNPDENWWKREPEQKCYFESLSPEDRMKPLSISCSCKRCSPFSMSSGSIQSVSSDAWTNTIAGKLQE